MNKPDEIGSAPSAPTTRSKNDLRGILLPFTTPFNPTEELDKEGLRSNLRKWNATGILGYVALGSTGERVNLDERDCAQVIEIAREEVPQNLEFIVGAGQQATRATIAETKQASAAGADAVLVITPHFYRAAITQDALLVHYRAVADASPVPVILYSMPDLTGIKIEPETVARLSDHPNIVGIKDSSADIPGLQQTLSLVPEDFAVLSGNGTVFATALGHGARGAILAVGCVAPDLCLEIYRLIESGEADKAAALQERLTPLAMAVTKRYGIGGLKAAMDMIGFAGRAVRAPLRAASAEAQAEIAALLDDLGIQSVSKTEVMGEQDEFAGVVRS
ncbi:MAG: dihydrodipicolinate synthase family protein [Pyrinomonadaceae bacterium]|nr:dihydrodipicolinate synthase family protein [Pyrinomonadaceae bacterium]